MFRPGGFPSPYVDIVPKANQPEPAFTVAARIQSRGRTWMALQPRELLQDQYHAEPGTTLTAILRRANEKACLEAVFEGQSGLSWYTMDEGLAGNLVTHLADQGGLWAACMDIY